MQIFCVHLKDPIALACSECCASEEKPFPLTALQAEVLSCQASQIIFWSPVKATFFHHKRFLICCSSPSREVKNDTVGCYRATTQLFGEDCNSTITQDYVFQLLPAAFQSNNQCLFHEFFRAGAEQLLWQPDIVNLCPYINCNSHQLSESVSKT